MNEKIKKVFDILGVEPNERFKIKYRKNNNIYADIYFIKEDLNIYAETKTTERWTDLKIRDLLIEHYEIIKLPKVTEKEQLAIDYLKECGYKWIAKDKDDKVFAFRTRPLKNFWSGWESASYVPDSLIVEIPISFISSEDEEPYYIGD